MPSGVNIALFEAILNIMKNTVSAPKLHLLCTNFNFFDFRVLKYIELMTPDAFLKFQLFVYLPVLPLDVFFNTFKNSPISAILKNNKKQDGCLIIWEA